MVELRYGFNDMKIATNGVHKGDCKYDCNIFFTIFLVPLLDWVMFIALNMMQI